MPHSDTKGDLPTDPIIKPPGGIVKPPPLPTDPGYGKPDIAAGRPDQSLPGNPIKPGKPAPLPGGGVRPDNALPEEPEAAPRFDEVQSGAEIPDENMQMLIAGTLGGSGDHHAAAKRIVERMHQANWTTTKALDEGIGDTRAKGRKPNASVRPDDRKDDERKDDKR